MSKITIQHNDVIYAQNAGKKVNTENFQSNLTIAEVRANTVTAAAIDSWARAFVGMTKDSYIDVKISEELSITEELAE